MNSPYTNIFNSKIGEGTKIGAFTEIGNARVGKNCKIQAFVFIPKGVTIGNNVFVGPGVVFCNDLYPSAKNFGKYLETIVEDDVSIGANSTILPGIILHKGCRIAAHSVVTKDVEEGELWLKK